MKTIKFERIAGEGENALYNLYMDGECVGKALFMSEVLERINGAYEPEKLTDPEPPLDGTCQHEWMYVADKDDTILYSCVKCKKLKTIRFGDPECLDPAFKLPTEKAVTL